MYCYVYDEAVTRPMYQRELEGIEMRLHDLDIQGTICRLSPLKNLQDILESGAKTGIKTVVAVGGDALVERIMGILVNRSLPLVLGIIPLGGADHDIAKSLSIPVGIDACNILSYRMIRTLRLGKINNRYFLSNVACQGNVRVECGGAFFVSAMHGPSAVKVNNNPYDPAESAPTPTLRLTMKAGYGRPLWFHREPLESVFFNERFTIHTKDRMVLTIDEHRMVATPPVTVESSNKQLRMITGALRPSIKRALAAHQNIAEKNPALQSLGW